MSEHADEAGSRHGLHASRDVIADTTRERTFTQHLRSGRTSGHFGSKNPPCSSRSNGTEHGETAKDLFHLALSGSISAKKDSSKKPVTPGEYALPLHVKHVPRLSWDRAEFVILPEYKDEFCLARKRLCDVQWQ